MAARRRVLFVIPSLRLGGAERVVALLLKHLPREHFELHIALVEAVGPFLDDLPDDVGVHDLGAGRVRNSFRPLLKLARELRPDVIVPNLNYLNLALLALKPFLPRGVELLLQETTTLSAEMSERKNGALWSLAYRLFYPRADTILCCSWAMVDDLVQNFGVRRERIRMIRNPIDVEGIEAAVTDGVSPFEGPGPHAVGVGRLSFEKGYDQLVEAFRRVVDALPAANLWLLGRGDERASLEARVAELGIADRVHFQGFVENPFPWMAHADVFVQSSRREGLPVAVLEAVACGARVVAFDAPGGTGEIVRELPGGALVPDGDLEGLADALIDAMTTDGVRPAGLPEEFRLPAVVRGYSDALGGGALAGRVR